MRKIPFLRLCLALILGIYSNQFFEGYCEIKFFSFLISFGLVVISFFISKISQKGILFFGTALLISTFILGVYVQESNKLENDKTHFGHIVLDKSVVFEGKIIEKTNSGNKSKYLIDVDSVIDSLTDFSCHGLLQIHSKIDTFQIGDIIKFNAVCSKFNPQVNLFSFDYQDFQNKKQIYFQAFPDYIKRIASHVSWAESLRESFTRRIINLNISSESKAIILAMLLGDKSGLTELKTIFQATGTSHVLAISGLHVGIIATLLNFLLLRIPTKYFWLKNLLIILGVWLFCILSGLAPSTVRASIMVSSFLIGISFKWKGFGFNFCFLSGFFMLLLNPNLLYDVGFQFSYLAILGILYYYEPLYKILSFKGFADRIWQMSVLSISAQIALTPLSLYYFHEFPMMFLIASIIAIPATFLIIILAIGTIVFSLLIENDFLNGILNLVIETFIQILKLFSEIDGSIITNLWPSFPELILYYVCLASLSIFFVMEKKIGIGAFLFGFIGLLLCQFYLNDALTKPQLIIYGDKKDIFLDIIQSGSAVQFSEKIYNQDKSEWFRRGTNQKFHVNNSRNLIFNTFENKEISVGNISVLIYNSLVDNNEKYEYDYILINKKVDKLSVLPLAKFYVDFASNTHLHALDNILVNQQVIVELSQNVAENMNFNHAQNPMQNIY